MDDLEARIARLERANCELAAREAHFRAIIKAEPQCVKVLARDGSLIDLNPAGLAMIEADSFDEVKGKSLYALVDEHDRENVRRLIESSFAAESGVTEFQCTGLKGRRRYLEMHVSPLRDQSGAITASLGITRDITPRKSAQLRQRRAESTLQTLIDAVPSFIAVVDAEGKYEVVNRRYEEWFSLPREQIVGQKITDLHRPSTYATMEQGIQQVLAGNPVQYDSEITGRDGKDYSFDVRYVPRTAPGGGVNGYFVLALDNTEHARAEAAKREAAERLRLAIAASNVGLWDWDLRTHKVNYSPEWKSQLGYRDDEVGDGLGEWERLVHPGDKGPALERARQYMEHRHGAFESEFRMLHKDGSWRWIYSRGEAFLDDTGKVVRLLGCHIDFTDRKRAAAAVAMAERRESMATVVGGVAHEFNSTLLAAATLLQSVDDAKCDADSRGPIARASELIQQAQALSASLLELYAGPERAERPVLELRSWLNERVEHLERSLPEGMAVSLHHEPRRTSNDGGAAEAEFLVLADPLALEQVLRALLGNASDALNGLGRVTITVGTHEQQDATRVTITVSDDGPGVPPELRDRLFDPYFSTRSRATRSGMGLAIAARLVEQAGGDLTYRAGENGGSSFVISLCTAGKDAQ